MTATKVTLREIDWSSFSLNMKNANNTGTTITNADQDLAAQGLSLSFTVSGTAYAFVTVSLGIYSTTDYECRPEVRLGGVVQATFSPNAAVGNASSRVSTRTFSAFITLANGANTISAGAFVSSGTGLGMAAGGGYISAIVFGNVTA